MTTFKNNQILNSIRAMIWPIERKELKLFLPMSFMMLCVLFNFATLRSVKDGVIIPTLGAEVISFLKIGLVLPSSIIFTILYVKLSNLLSSENLFYLIVTTFLLAFFIFGFIVLPYENLYHPSKELIAKLVLQYPHLQWVIKIYGKWSYAIFYVFAELWSVVVINLMFWQFANSIFNTEQATRFYPVLGMIGNFGLILAGSLLMNCSAIAFNNECKALEFSTEKQLMLTLQPIILAVIGAGCLAMALFKFINSVILTSSDLHSYLGNAKTKTKLSVRESINLILQSKYLGHIVILILCYGFIINILEGPWKSKLKELYPNNVDYIKFMGEFNVWLGIFSVTFMVVGSNILRKTNWLFAAMFTPITILITGALFFFFVVLEPNISFLGKITPLYAAVLAGAAQNILSKSTKYSLFDSTKEMSYIPLPLELKTKGKAAVDVVALKVGKSFGGIIQSSLFTILPVATFESITWFLMIVFFIIVIVWIWDIKSLNREYLNLINKKS